MTAPPQAPRGRAAALNPDNRYARSRREDFDDGWERDDEPAPTAATEWLIDASRSVIARNQSPDVPFDRSINPYRGCEHGCIYCFARPTHAWLDLSPGLDFETRIHYKPDAARLLRAELARPGYRCAPIALGINTDAYQPGERRFGLTRSLLEVLLEHRHPVSIVTKSALIERDLDLLAELARANLVEVAISLTTRDRQLARRMEPRAAAPERRLETLRRLRHAGIPTSVLVAPVIPFLNDDELEDLLAAARAADALDAGYVLLRLPLEVAPLFEDWLNRHYPLKAERIMKRMRDCRGGANYDSRFGLRMRGEGVYADLLRARFRRAHGRLGFQPSPPLDCEVFRVPDRPEQLGLF